MKLGLGAAALSSMPRAFAQVATPVQSSDEAPAGGNTFAATGAIIAKPIPSTGELIPVIGIGTARRYEQMTEDTRPELKEVLRLFPLLGGRVIDTAPAYGEAESVVGELTEENGNRSRYFFATKVGGGGGGRGGPGRGGPGRGGPEGAAGRGAPGGPEGAPPGARAGRGGGGRGGLTGLESIEQSFRNLRTDRIDLVAVWNLGNVDENLAILRELKAAGRIRYLGVTTSSEGQYEQLEQIMLNNDLDFIQCDYAIDNREVEARILPLAADRGIGVMTNLPFGRERLWTAVQGQSLPDFAREFDCTTWAQFFLKYIVSHPAVTCAIPGTARVRYVHDNIQAAMGRLPDAAMRRRMEDAMAAI